MKLVNIFKATDPTANSLTIYIYIVTYTTYVWYGSVTNNSTWIRIGYRIYSLWRFITTPRLQLLATDTITHN
jgi:hypothetical protein